MTSGSIFHINDSDSVYLSMKFAFVTFLSVFLIGCAGKNSSESNLKSERESILFIGNSYTYRNGGIDKHLDYLLAGTNGPKDPFIRRATQGKYHLYTHWKDAETREIFKSKKWDKVILQEYSSGPIRENRAFQKYAKRWANEIRKANKNAKIFLYSTWNYKNIPGMEDSVYSEYQKVSQKINASVVPVGLLWKKLRNKINLYDGDGAHPNRKGTFVTACLFYETLFGLDVTKTDDNDPMLSKSEQKRLKKWAHEFHLMTMK